MECDRYAEVIGNGLDGTRKLGIRGAEIVMLHDSVGSTTMRTLNGIQFHGRFSWSKTFEDEAVGIAVATI
jgi:hypothetical protein